MDMTNNDASISTSVCSMNFGDMTTGGVALSTFSLFRASQEYSGQLDCKNHWPVIDTDASSPY